MNTNSGTLEPLLGKDPEVFMESVVGDYGKKIYNFAYRMTGNPQDAEDMVQETFLRVYRSLDSFRGECNFSTWIYRIAANLCTDKFRRMRKRPLSIDFPINNEDDRLRYEIPDDSPSPAEMAEMSELKECIMQAINNLPKTKEVLPYSEMSRGSNTKRSLTALLFRWVLSNPVSIGLVSPSGPSFQASLRAKMPSR
jgi:RNA polymerase sigma-70 factor (ECF subfamily)